jgi:tetratricopeptide (TPR) repeat protein
MEDGLMFNNETNIKKYIEMYPDEDFGYYKLILYYLENEYYYKIFDVISNIPSYIETERLKLTIFYYMDILVKIIENDFENFEIYNELYKIRNIDFEISDGSNVDLENKKKYSIIKILQKLKYHIQKKNTQKIDDIYNILIRFDNSNNAKYHIVCYLCNNKMYQEGLNIINSCESDTTVDSKILYFTFGWIHYYLQNYERALTYFILSNDDNNSLALCYIALTYEKLEEYQSSLMFFNKFDHDEFYNNVIMNNNNLIYILDNKCVLNEILSLDDKKNNLLRIKISIFQLMKKYQQIIDMLMKYKNKDEYHLYYIARGYYNMEHLDEAKKYILQSLRKNSNVPEFYLLLGNIHYAEKEYYNAMTTFIKIKNEKYLSEVYISIAKCCLCLKNYNKSKYFLKLCENYECNYIQQNIINELKRKIDNHLLSL